MCNQVFGGVFVLPRCFFDFSVSVGAFVIGLSQISSFFSYSCDRFLVCRVHYTVHFNACLQNYLLLKVANNFDKRHTVAWTKNGVGVFFQICNVTYTKHTLTPTCCPLPRPSTSKHWHLDHRTNLTLNSLICLSLHGCFTNTYFNRYCTSGTRAARLDYSIGALSDILWIWCNIGRWSPLL